MTGNGKRSLKLVAEIDLDVMQAELLELDPAEIMDVGRVAFHFLEIEIDFRLRDGLGVIRADNFGALMKPTGAAAPARPDAKAQVIHRQFRRRHDVEHAHERLHAVEFAAHIFTEHAALEVGQDGLGLQGATEPTPFRVSGQAIRGSKPRADHAKHDAVNGEGGETMPPHPMEKPGDDREADEKGGDKANARMSQRCGVIATGAIVSVAAWGLIVLSRS